jgi:hypothetical protein
MFYVTRWSSICHQLLEPLLRGADVPSQIEPVEPVEPGQPFILFVPKDTWASVVLFVVVVFDSRDVVVFGGRVVLVYGG